MALLILIFPLICIAAWAAGEFLGITWLRIAGMVLGVPVICVVSYGLGSFSGSTDTSIRTTGATARFIEAAHLEIENGNAEKVHDELKRLDGRINWTYESAAFSEAMDEATRRVSDVSSE